jgi:hypothetical protein
LEALGPRWLHTLGVVERVREIGDVLEPGHADVLVAAAFVHDIGYAPELARTGFHPLDGARFVLEEGHERLAGLVAHHSQAEFEASERGLLDALQEFEDEHSLLSQALTYCDLTTDHEGRRVTPSMRLAEIRQRYGAAALESRALGRSEEALLADARAVEDAIVDRTQQLAENATEDSR